MAGRDSVCVCVCVCMCVCLRTYVRVSATYETYPLSDDRGNERQSKRLTLGPYQRKCFHSQRPILATVIAVPWAVLTRNDGPIDSRSDA